jgi:predicted sugar kinase
MTLGPYVRIQVDESFLDKVFKQLEVRLDKHEEWIIELQKLLRNKPDRSELKELYELIQNELESRFGETNNRISALEQTFNSSLRDLESRMLGRVQLVENSFDQKLRDQITSLEKKIPEADGRIERLIERMDSAENTIHANDKKLHLTRDSVQHIASSIAHLNQTRATLDSSLPDTLKSSVNTINDRFTEIFDELEKIRERQQIASIMDRASASPRADGPPVSSVPSVAPEWTETSRSVPPASAPPQQSVTAPQVSVSSDREIPVSGLLPPEVQPGDTGMKGERLNIEKRTIMRERVVESGIDISGIKLYPAVNVHWMDPPELPSLRQFVHIEEVVDYLYRMVPKLQAHLNAMHRKVVELNSEMLDKIDRSLVEKMFDRFQAVIGEVKHRFDDLKDAVEQTATRDEINKIVEDLFNQFNMENETSIGRVKCIVCGRETTKVAGALSESDVARALGNPPNSIAYHAPNPAQPVGVAYSSKEGFDSAIMESPRAGRPYRPLQVRPKLKTTPLPNSG